jgi:hypothetical protein
MPTQPLDESLLQAALEGLEIQRQRIQSQIAQVQELMGHRGPVGFRRSVTFASVYAEGSAAVVCSVLFQRFLRLFP